MFATILICFAGLFVIWVAYPLAIAALATIRRRQPPRPTDSPRRLSVIIATREGLDEVRGRVQDILASTYPVGNLEVIVAIDRSASHLDALEREPWPTGVRVVRGELPGGKAATLNAGAAAATGDLLVFTDTAQRFEHSALRALAARLEDPRVGMVSGSLRIGNRGSGAIIGSLYWRYERWLRRNEAAVHSAVGVTGAIYGVRRSLWQALPAGLILDDLFTPMRLVMQGYRIAFSEDAVAFDPRVVSPAMEYRRKARTLTGVIQLCAWLPSVLLPARNPIWVQFVFHKVLRLLTPILLAVGTLALALALGTQGRMASAESLLVVATLLAALLAVRRVRSAIVWAAATQGAALRALLNGVRGRWDVWTP